MSIIRYYNYFYYKIYNSIEYTSKSFGGAFLSELKTGIVMIALEFWIVLSFYNYYTVITKQNLYLSLNKPIVFIPLFIIIFSKWYFFADKKKWLPYRKEFDSLPLIYNKKGTLIVVSISVLIVVNLIFSFYLLSKK